MCFEQWLTETHFMAGYAVIAWLEKTPANPINIWKHLTLELLLCWKYKGKSNIHFKVSHMFKLKHIEDVKSVFK